MTNDKPSSPPPLFRLLVDSAFSLVVVLALLAIASALWLVQSTRSAGGPTLCVEGVRASAWVDSDEDGVWDNEEQALAGVTFAVSGFADGVVSGEDGIAWLRFEVDCDTRDEIAWWVTAETHEGYRPTGRTRANRFGPFQFGFVPTE